MCTLICLMTFALKVCENEGAKFLSVGMDVSKSTVVMCEKDDQVFAYAFDKVRIVGMDAELRQEIINKE